MASKARQLAQSASAPEGRKNVVINGAMQSGLTALSLVTRLLWIVKKHRVDNAP